MTRKVCLIDDDDLFREHLALNLQARGIACVEAGDVRTGLQLAQDAAVDVAVVDILMPGMDGIEAIRAFAKALPNVRVIAMSGGGREGPGAYLDAASRLGAHAVFLKPIVIADLVSAIEA